MELLVTSHSLRIFSVISGCDNGKVSLRYHLIEAMLTRSAEKLFLPLHPRVVKNELIRCADTLLAHQLAEVCRTKGRSSRKKEDTADPKFAS